MFRAVSLGWISKLIVIILTLINTRLLVDIVGLDGLAAYAILISLTTWISLFNLGIPFAVQSLISKYRVEGKDYREIKMAAITIILWMLIIFFPMMTGVAILVKKFVLEHYSFTTILAVFIACSLILMGALTQILTQILFAEFKPIWPNLLPAMNAILVFVGLLVLSYGQFNNFDITLCISLLPNAILFVFALWLMKETPTFKLKAGNLSEIFRTAKGYLVFSTLSALTLAVDYLIMSRLISVSDIATYNLMSKAFGVILSIHAVLLANAWSGMGDHLHAGHFSEARQKIKGLLIIGLIGGLFAGLCLVFSMEWIMLLLTGGKVVVVSTTLMLIWVCYILIRIWSDTFAMGLMSFNKMSVMNGYITFQGVINVIAQYIFASYFGLSGILLGLICSYVVTASWILPKHFYKETYFKISINKNN